MGVVCKIHSRDISSSVTSAGASGGRGAGGLAALNKIWPLQPEGWPVIINVLQ